MSVDAVAGTGTGGARADEPPPADAVAPGDPAGPSAGRRPIRRSLLQLLAFTVVVGVAGSVLPLSRSDRFLLDLWLVSVAAGTAYRWVYALAGRFSFAQALMMVLGAYTSAKVTEVAGPAWFLAGLLAAVAGVAVVGAVVAAIARRTDGFAFAIVTLAMTELGRRILSQTPSFSGDNGSVLGIEPMTIAGRTYLEDGDVFWILLVVVGLLLALACLIEHSPLRRDALAARTQGAVAAGLGVPVARVRLTLFVLGCAGGGLVGALMGHWQGFVGPDTFGIDFAIGLLLIVQLGGTGSPWGPVVGAAVYVGLPEVLSGLEEYQAAIYGGLLLVTVLAVPEGLTGLPARIRGRHRTGRVAS